MVKKKKGVKRMNAVKPKKTATKKTNAVKKKSGKNNLGKYNAIQKILSNYLKENNIKVGKDFSKIASALNKRAKDVPLKYIEQNIHTLYNEFYKNAEQVGEFPENFPFYLFNQTLLTQIFDDATVTFSFDDGIIKFDYSGDSSQARDKYVDSGLYRHLRKYYNNSPTATFVLKSKSGKSVEYTIETYAEPTETVSEKPLEAPTTQKKDEVVVPYSASEIIAIEKEKQKTLKQVQKLMKQGWTKEEILKLLGK